MTKHKADLSKQDASKVPVWVILAVMISVLPVLGWPFYMMRYNFGEDQPLLWAILFPICIVACGYLACRCYLIRKEITYVILLMMWLSYATALVLLLS